MEKLNWLKNGKTIKNILGKKEIEKSTTIKIVMIAQIYQVSLRLVPSLQKGLLTPENLTVSCSVFSSWQYSQNVTMQWSFL